MRHEVKWASLKREDPDVAVEGRSHESQEGENVVLGGPCRARLHSLSHANGQPRHHVAIGSNCVNGIAPLQLD